MADLITSFRAFVARERLFTKEDNLLLACSGGLDSTVLAHLLHAGGYRFALVHMNFGLRGTDSDADAQFVRDLARTLGAKEFVRAVATATLAQEDESMQMTARRIRYNYFEEIMDESSYDYLLTAHHADDNLETVLINLLRGTGVRGLAGMAPARGRYRRPLLEADRALILDYARQHKLAWREDASNATDNYLRNRLRHHLTPRLRDDFGLKTEGWNRTAAHLRAGVEIYRHGLDGLRKTHVRSTPNEWVLKRGTLSAPVLTTMLRDELVPLGFTDEQIRQLVAAPGQWRLRTPAARVDVYADRFECVAGVSQETPPLPAVRIDELPYATKAARFVLNFELVSRPAELDEPGVHYLAPPSFPLHLRPRRHGDRLQPLGLNGTKKLKDYLIDRKVPAWQRDRLYLLTDDAGTLLAVPGLCVTETGRVLPEHEEVLRITYR